MKQISIKELIESPSATSPRKGLQVFEAVKTLIERGETVVVSFIGIDEVVTAFVNAAFGRLYMEVPKSILEERLKIVGARDIWISKVNLAIKLATDDKVRNVHNSSIDELMES